MIKSRITTISILFCALFGVASTLTAFAAEYYWNVASGDWSDGANWDPTGPPTGYGWGIIANGGTANIDTDIVMTDVHQIRPFDGTVNQAANDVETQWLMLGNDGESGVYNLSGGTLDVSRDLQIGKRILDAPGDGYFNMSGGTLNVTGFNGLSVGDGEGSYGEFNISAGTVEINYDFIVGNNTAMGDGIVNQTGGVINLDGNLYISKYYSNPFDPLNGYGIYNMEGGNLYVTGERTDNTGDIFVGSEDGTNAGIMNLKGGEIAVFNFYVTSANSYVSDKDAIVGAGATLGIWGDFINNSHARTDFDLRHTTVIMHGGTGWDDELQDWDFNILDMNSWDVGASVDGLDINFAIGNLVFSGSATGSEYYRLESDIYCFGLSIEAGALIDLNGYNIYYMPQGCGAYSGITPGTFQLSGMWGNMEFGEYGDVIVITDAPPVPEPGTIMLIGSGILALAGVIRKRIT